MSFAFLGLASRPLAIVAIAVLAGCATPKQTVPEVISENTSDVSNARW